MYAYKKQQQQVTCIRLYSIASNKEHAKLELSNNNHQL